MGQLARMVRVGMMSVAKIVDCVIQSQFRYKLGAWLVLYALLEILEVRDAINGHCKTKAEVDHGTVALVLVMNRLMLPLPLSQIFRLGRSNGASGRVTDSSQQVQ
ncbi:MAG: hypothetical protein AAF702_37020 [Chloroflexota bacterium]